MVQSRLNPQLQGRVDGSDVVQEANLEIARRLEEYLQDPRAPLFLWMRSIVEQKIIDIHRRHLDAQMRDAKRDVSLYAGPSASADSRSLAAAVADSASTPSRVAARAETVDIVREALENMSSTDQEILRLRHFEQLSNAEVAGVLGLSESGATARYVRALKRLKERLAD